MHNIYIGEFFLLYFLMAAVFILCLIHETLALKKHKKANASIWTSRAISFSTVILFLINLIGYDFDPRIKLCLYIVLLIVSLFLLCKEINSKFGFIILTIFFAVFIIFDLCLLGPCTFTRIIVGDPYVSVYSPFTGTGETYAYNFEPCFSLFIKTKAHSVDNYGIHLGDWREIPSLDPISTEYFD